MNDLLLLIPFIGIFTAVVLSQTALFSHTWEKPWVQATTAIVAILSSIGLVIAFKDGHEVLMAIQASEWSGVAGIVLKALRADFSHPLFDGVNILALIVGYYIPASGIRIKGDIVSTPGLIMRILVIGIILAAIIGTSGASILAATLLASSIKERKYKFPIIFAFAWTVGNIAGGYSPPADTPIQLIFRRGVSLEWIVQQAPLCIALCAAVLFLYWLVDGIIEYGLEPIEQRHLDVRNYVPWRSDRISLINFTLMFVNGACLMFLPSGGLAEAGMLVVAAVSFFISNPHWQEEKLDWAPYFELAAILSGLLAAAIPVEVLLGARVDMIAEHIHTPMDMFWVMLYSSGYFDNGPISLIGIEMLRLMKEAGIISGNLVEPLGVPSIWLRAVEWGAVIGGLTTPIGNFPSLYFLIILRKKLGANAIPGFLTYTLVSTVVITVLCIIIVPMFLK